MFALKIADKQFFYFSPSRTFAVNSPFSFHSSYLEGSVQVIKKVILVINVFRIPVAQ